MKVAFEKNGLIKEVKVGFSWTTLFFAGWPQVFWRGEVLVGLLVWIAGFLTMGIFGIIWAFKANGYTARKLIENGWKLAEPNSLITRAAAGKWNIVY